MSNGDNPYGGARGAGNYATNVEFGAPAARPQAAPRGNGAPKAALIKDTTTAGFAADVLQEFESPACSGRFLGAVVRALPATRARCWKRSSARRAARSSW